jgi:glycosyltransferase involved in cell wall biosynthesis
MKFSIITPSYNQGRYLPDCIASVMAQENVEVEHIVIDALSTDETLEVLRSHPHLIWSSEKDEGMSDGINKGFLKATGDWLMWLNCDDFLLRGTLDKVARHIRKNPEADIVNGDTLFVKNTQTVIRRKYDHPMDENVLLYVGCYIPSTSTFIKRDVIQSGHLLDISYKVCMDWEYYLRLLRTGHRFSYIPESLAGFRWHDTNTSLIHRKRGEAEGRKLQLDHLIATEKREELPSRFALNMLRRFHQLRRVALRLRTHGRVR